MAELEGLWKSSRATDHFMPEETEAMKWDCFALG